MSLISFERIVQPRQDGKYPASKNDDGSFTICAEVAEFIEEEVQRLEGTIEAKDDTIKRLEKEIEAHIHENLMSAYQDALAKYSERARNPRRSRPLTELAPELKELKKLVGPTLAEHLEGLSDMAREGAQEAVENARIGYCDYRGN